jgi:drug/metabolite transporter (DMT)-like permease
VLGVVLALCAAGCNAVGTVFQRKAARNAPADETMRPALLWDLARRPVWLLGIGGMIGGFVCQAAALHFAELSLVQPIVVFELPLTLAVGAAVFHRPLDRHAVWGTVAVSAGVSLVLVAIAPQPGRAPAGFTWIIAVVATLALVAVLIVAGLRSRGSRRAALFGVASGLGFGFTAALMNAALHVLDHGVVALLTTWPAYATVAAGIGSVFLVQNALQAGSIVAAQPAVTSCDPLASVAYGVLVFGEQLRGGIWLVPTTIGAVVGIAGTVLLARSPLIEAQEPVGSK